MSVRGALTAVLSAPSAGDLWRLRAEMLEAGIPAGAKVWRVVDEFRHYLDELATGTSSKDYSRLASKLDIGAVSGVVVEHMVESEDSADLGMRLLSAILSEGLMILATRQHVKAWEGELAVVYRNAAWYLYEELWRWAENQKPELPSVERRRLLDRLIAPIHSADTGGYSKAVLLGLLFQTLLVSYLSQAMAGLPDAANR